MEYALLIYAADENPATDPSQRAKIMSEYGDFTRDLAATGKMGDCAALDRLTTATTVRVRDGKRLVTDGPFAETRERLGGYYCIQAETEEEAAEVGSKIPTARFGSIEVRPVPSYASEYDNSPIAAAPEGASKEYILLIYEDEKNWTTLSPEASGIVFQKYAAFTKSIKESGHFIAGAPLEPVAKAKTVRKPDAKAVVTDGPFAETREQLGGYYRVRARHLDDALEMAARIPAVEGGSIEVRPVLDTSAYT